MSRDESELLDLRVGGWLPDLDLGWIRASDNSSGLETLGFSDHELEDHGFRLDSPGSRNEASVVRFMDSI